MSDNILLDEIRKPEDRTLIYRNVTIKIQAIEDLILEFEKQNQAIMSSLDFEKKEYDVAFNQNQERAISTAEFSRIDSRHRHRMDELNLKKLSLERTIESKKNWVQRLWCLGWILNMPYGEKKVQVEKKSTGEKFTIYKKDIYNRFFENIVSAEKSRLLNEQSTRRLQFDFNNISDYPVHPEHEFYISNDQREEKLEIVQDKLRVIGKYEGKQKYSQYIDFHRLTLGDFMNENSEQLFEQLFMGDEKQNVI